MTFTPPHYQSDSNYAVPHSYLVIGDRAYEVIETDLTDVNDDETTYTVYVRRGNSFRRLSNACSALKPVFTDSFFPAD